MKKDFYPLMIFFFILKFFEIDLLVLDMSKPFPFWSNLQNELNPPINDFHINHRKKKINQSMRALDLFKKKSPPKVFGESLEVICQKSEDTKATPAFLKSCFSFLDQYGILILIISGLKQEGLYSVAGNKKVVKDYIKRIEKGEKLDFISIHEKTPLDVHTIASLVLKFFSELPETIFTKNLEDKFIAATSKCL